MESSGRLPDPMKFEGNLNENFKIYKQNFDMYMIATEKDSKPDKIKIAMFLNTIGGEGLEIYNTFKLAEADKKDYKKVVGAFAQYCAPRKNKTYERFVFSSTTQAKDEQFEHYYGDLKKLVKSMNMTRRKTRL
ncbi:hypothetical protein QE152_g25077 [Popillia japonica]|uniref:Uncharacterized protein n=1 Tax=Popillia japonica TaxID=7064 RepID=A0AAW1K2W3_POPJA